MHKPLLTLSYAHEISYDPASAVESLSVNPQLVAVLTLDTTAALVLPVTFDSTRITATHKERYAIDTEQAVQWITALD